MLSINVDFIHQSMLSTYTLYTMLQGGGLNLAGHQVLTKPLYCSLSSTGQGAEIRRKDHRSR